IKEMKRFFLISLTMVFCFSHLAFAQKERFEEGEKYFKKGDYNKAIAIFREIVNKAEKEELAAKSALRLGQCYWALNDYDMARHFFTEAMGWGGDIAVEAKIGIAVTYLSEKKYDKTIELLSNAISQYKNDKILAYAYFNRGLAYESKNEISKAINDLVRAKEKAKDDKEFLQAIEKEIKKCRSLYEEFKNKESDYLQKIRLAQGVGDFDGCAVLLRELAKLCEDWGEIESAIDYEKQAIDYSTSEEFKAGSWMNIGWRYCKEGNYQKAAEAFKQIADDYPQSSFAKEALHRLGDMLSSAGKNEEAIKVYQEFLEKYPQDEGIGEVMMNLAWRFRAKGDWDKEKKTLEEISKLFPNSELGLFALGLMYEDEGLKGNLQAFEKAAELHLKASAYPNPQGPVALLGAANCYFFLGRYREALETVNKLLKEYPDLYQEAAAEARWIKVKCYIGLKQDREKIIALLQQIAEEYPNTRWAPSAYREIVRLYIYSGEITLANKMCEELAILYKDTYPNIVFTAFSSIGDYYYERGDYDNAIEWYNKAGKSVARYSAKALLGIGRCYILKGDLEKAITVYRQIIQEQTDKAERLRAFMELGRCLYQKGAKEEAKSVFQRVIKEFPNTTDTTEAKNWLEFLSGE
ncbi:MAG: tetratricopeptide repeat protein, partial [bacterium]